MAGPSFVLDIGATLVEGPDRGPATRIAAALGLDGRQKRRLEAALMTRAWEDPSAVTAFLRDEMGVAADPDPHRAIEAIRAAASRHSPPRRPPDPAARRPGLARLAHIRNTPNLVSGMGALRAAASASARTRRVSAGARMPSSQSRAVA